MGLEDLLRLPETDPAPLYRYRDGIATVDLLAAAIAHLDLFTGLSERPLTLEEILGKFRLQRRPAEVLMTLLVALGLAERVGPRFVVSALGREHLVASSPWNMAPYFAAMKDRPQTLDMVQVLRTGHPANWGGYDPQAWVKAMERPEFAAQFTAAMDCRGTLLAPALAQRLDLSQHTALLDVAGGSGVYACALAAQHPHLRLAVFEKPPVDDIAREAIARRGASERVEVLRGDMLDDAWPGDYDVHLLSNVVHDWDVPMVRRLLARSAAALPPGGWLVIHDAFLNEEKTGPLAVAEYSALLMSICEGRCYSVKEAQTFLADSGFRWLDHQPTALSRSFVVARKV